MTSLSLLACRTVRAERKDNSEWENNVWIICLDMVYKHNINLLTYGREPVTCDGKAYFVGIYWNGLQGCSNKYPQNMCFKQTVLILIQRKILYLGLLSSYFINSVLLFLPVCCLATYFNY